MAMIGYARVSSISQSTDIQVAQLEQAGCDMIRTEQVSGSSREGRDELATIMDFLRPEDQLVVVKLDRLGRSTRDVLNLVHEIEQEGASLRVLEPEIDTSGPMGRVILTVLSMVAEMELSFIRERQRVGIEKAKANGKYKGRKPSIDRAAVQRLHEEGWGASAIAKELGIGRASVYRSLSKEACRSD